MALKIVLTTAGRAALRNAAANGTNAVTVASVGVTSTAFTPDAATATIPDEIKRIATISGGTTAADTIHVTVNDHSSDTYSVNGIGIYLADGTLFGSFSQADALVQKSAQATLLLAIDAQFADIDATQLVFGDTNFQLNQATTEAVGVVELATGDETTTGTDATRVVTPAGLLAALNARLGSSAPSTFVKSILTAASAAILRTALAIKDAALYDPGSGNGLDADLLDGQHGSYYLAWANQTGVPASFPPSSHTHSAGDITSGTLPVARGGTGANSFTAGNYLIGNGTSAVGEKTPADVLTDIGAAAKAHSHAISDVNGLQDTLNAKAPLASPALKGTPTINGNYILQSNSGNVIYLGWQKYTSGKVGLTVDATQIGDIATEAWSKSTFPVLGVRNSSFGTALISGAPPDIAHITSSGNGNNIALTLANASNTSASAVMAFLRDGQFGCFFGLDTDNQLKVGGWSFGSNSYAVFHEGRLPSKGNIVSSLGFNPVQQGTGVNQTSNIIAIGHSSDGPRLTVDATDFGPFTFRKDFTSSMATNGWARLPDGRIEQWGFLSAANVGDGTTGTITFPIAFPNACLNVDISDRRNTDASKDVDCYAYVNGTPSNSSFGYYVMAPAGSPNYWQGMFWRAIGY